MSDRDPDRRNPPNPDNPPSNKAPTAEELARFRALRAQQQKQKQQGQTPGRPPPPGARPPSPQNPENRPGDFGASGGPPRAPQQQRPPQGMPPQGQPRPAQPPQQRPPQPGPRPGMPVQPGTPRQPQPGQGGPPSNRPPQRRPPQGMPPQGRPQPGMPPQQRTTPPQGPSPDTRPTTPREYGPRPGPATPSQQPQQMRSPQQRPPQGMPPQGQPRPAQPPQQRPLQPGPRPGMPVQPGTPGQPPPGQGGPPSNRPPQQGQPLPGQRPAPREYGPSKAPQMPASQMRGAPDELENDDGFSGFDDFGESRVVNREPFQPHLPHREKKQPQPKQQARYSDPWDVESESQAQAPDRPVKDRAAAGFEVVRGAVTSGVGTAREAHEAHKTKAAERAKMRPPVPAKQPKPQRSLRAPKAPKVKITARPDTATYEGPAGLTWAERAREAGEWVGIIAVAIVVALIVKAVAIQAFFIPSESMFPLLTQGDRVVVDKVVYHFGSIHRGDVIVFHRPPGEPDKDENGKPVTHLIKRVIGLPGDTVEGIDGVVYVNGVAQNEPYVPDDQTTDNLPKTVVPQGMLWVMGDNREDSQDSRFFGAITEKSVVGRADFLVWPVTKFKHI